MCFIGRRMKEQALSRQRFLEDWEYVLDTGSYDSTSQIRKPKRNTVYSIGEELKIYYKDQWYNFQEKDKDTGIAVVPIEGLITYLGLTKESVWFYVMMLCETTRTAIADL